LNTDDLNALMVPLTAGLLVAVLLLECWVTLTGRDHRWRCRAPFYFCAAVMFWLSASGVKDGRVTSMTRYALTIHVMLVLPALHLLARRSPLRGPVRTAAFALLAVLVGLSLGLQLWLTHHFMSGKWVA
jgi:hypothetical protein